MRSTTKPSTAEVGRPDYSYRPPPHQQEGILCAPVTHGVVVAEWFYVRPSATVPKSGCALPVDLGQVEKGRLYSLRESARRLRLDRGSSLRRAIEEGLIAAVQVGSATRICGEELVRILREGLPTLPGGRRPPRRTTRRAQTKKARPAVGSIAKIPL